ncbi:MAG: SIS domain-containing protein, partial [Candidatus Nanopelagicales bacterium]
RDASEHPDTSAIAEAVIQTCERAAVPYESVMAHGGHAIEQLADLVGLIDFASVYTALMQRRDPSRSAGDLDPRFGRRNPRSPDERDRP